MLVPRYWAEGRAQKRAAGRQVTVRRFGWSRDSQAEADAMAQSRAQDALARILAGEDLPRRDRKVPYNGTDGLPIREEVVEEVGRAILTRNAYGAVCLNVEDVLIADVDFEAPPGLHWALWLLPPLVAVALGREAGWALGVSCLVFLWMVVGLGRAVWRWSRARVGQGQQAPALGRVERFVAHHVGWSVRVYRTPAGLRLIATQRPFDTQRDAGVIAEFFKAVQADPNYARMCNTQRCFRARLTPKPWRVGIQEPMRPRPGVWPVDPERLPQRLAWVAKYQLASAGHDACRYLRTLGVERMHVHVAPVVALHDERSGALGDGPIA